MGFLDNSGDIILDAVLTDTGRMRLAKGDGSFKIVKFACGDDEINYEKYNADHASGSAYADLDILTTPVFEAFTNNTSLLKSKLITIPRTNLQYLPVIKINSDSPDTLTTSFLSDKDLFLISVDSDTQDQINDTIATQTGLLNGFQPNMKAQSIRLDQGLDTTDISFKFTLDPDLVENNYIVEMDNRFGQIISSDGATLANPSFIDDDNIASYYLPFTGNSKFVKSNNYITDSNNQAIAGPRGTYLNFKIKASVELASSTFLFTKLGPTSAIAGATVAALLTGLGNFFYIDTTVRVTGGTTGYRVDVPIRYIKYSA